MARLYKQTAESMTAPERYLAFCRDPRNQNHKGGLTMKAQVGLCNNWLATLTAWVDSLPWHKRRRR